MLVVVCAAGCGAALNGGGTAVHRGRRRVWADYASARRPLAATGWLRVGSAAAVVRGVVFLGWFR